MKATNEWNMFLNSGKVSDYLSYKVSDTDQEFDKERQKEAGYAGFFDGNRNGDKDTTYRGIR